MKVDIDFDMTSHTLGCLFPFGGYHRVEDTGITYGMAKTAPGDTGDKLGMLQVDRLARASPHRFFVGRSGSGKSFDIKRGMLEELARNENRQTVIVDIARGFDSVVKAFEGSKITVGETTINPFAIRPPAEAKGTEQSLTDKVRLIADMFQIYLMANAPEKQAKSIRPTLELTIQETFKAAGITKDISTHSKPSPTMEDYFDTLEAIADDPADYTFKQTETEVNELESEIGVLLTRLKQFQPGKTYDFLWGESEIDMFDEVVYFDMNKYENDTSPAKSMMLALITSHAYELAKQSKGHVSVVIDEAHDLFRDNEQAGQIESMVRAGRTTGLMFDFISQAGEDFNEDAAEIIAKQCSIAVWRDLGEMDVETPRDFGLTPQQSQLVSGSLAPGDNDALDYSEALVDIEGERYLVETRVSDYAARLMDYREADHGSFEGYMAPVMPESDRTDKAFPSDVEGAAGRSEAGAGPDSQIEETPRPDSETPAEAAANGGQENLLGSGVADLDEDEESDEVNTEIAESAESERTDDDRHGESEGASDEPEGEESDQEGEEAAVADGSGEAKSPTGDSGGGPDIDAKEESGGSQSTDRQEE
jgi:hypothetical protein